MKEAQLKRIKFLRLKKEGIPIEDKYENLMEYNIYTIKILKMFWKFQKEKFL